MLNGCKERNSSGRSPGLRIFPSDEEKEGDACTKAILTGISQRQRLFDLQISGREKATRAKVVWATVTWGQSRDWDAGVLGPAEFFLC